VIATRIAAPANNTPLKIVSLIIAFCYSLDHSKDKSDPEVPRRFFSSVGRCSTASNQLFRVVGSKRERGLEPPRAARLPRQAGRVAIAPHGHRTTPADEIELAGLRCEEGGNPIAPAGR